MQRLAVIVIGLLAAGLAGTTAAHVLTLRQEGSGLAVSGVLMAAEAKPAPSAAGQRIGLPTGWRLEVDSAGLPLLSAKMMLTVREDHRLHYLRVYNEPTRIGRMRPADMPAQGFSMRRDGDELIYTYGQGGQFKVLANGISPAILLESTASAVRLFDGKKHGIKEPSDNWTQCPTADFVGNPSLVAIPTAGGVRVRKPDAQGRVDLSGLSANWLLMWFGKDTYLWGGSQVNSPNRGPTSGWLFVPSKCLRPVDMPVLVACSGKPEGVQLVSDGGVEVQFGSGKPAGRIAVMPILGSRYPYVEETAAWASALPAEIAGRCQWWYDHLGQFPVEARQTFAVDPASLDVTITDTFTFRSMGHGKPWAPLAPAVALAQQEGLPVRIVGGEVIDARTPLEIGPLKGIENCDRYSYTVPGLAKYAYERPVAAGQGKEPQWLADDLAREVAQVVRAGHLAPWRPLFSKTFMFSELAIWGFSYETILFMSDPLSLTGDALAGQLRDYLRSERQAYPPESYVRQTAAKFSAQTIPYDQGARRESHPVDLAAGPDVLKNLYDRTLIRHQLTLYALAQYYLEMGPREELAKTWPTIRQILSKHAGHDWALMDQGNLASGGRRRDEGGMINVDRMAAAAIGHVRLAVLAGDAEARDQGLYQLNRALIARFALDKLVKHLYQTGLQTVPPEPDWTIQGTMSVSETGEAQLWRAHWAGWRDDPRRPYKYDRMGVVLADAIHVEPELLAYMDLTPEVGRFIRDYLLPEAENWMAAVEENSPVWYRAQVESYFGTENPISLPHNAVQVFNVKAWVLQAPPEELATYVDVPWVRLGDYYYIHKLAETVKAFRGRRWEAQNPEWRMQKAE
jgi:hypothetical protein